MPAVTVLTDETFTQQLLSSNRPVLVDFWASWCGPCRMMGPMIEQIAEAHADRLMVAKLNIDENPQTAEACKVMSVPTISVFIEGHPIKQITGAKSKSALLRELADFL